MAQAAKSGTGSRRKRILAVIALVIAALVVAAAVYLNTGIYHADATAEAALQSDADVQVSQTDDYLSFVGPDDDPANTRALVLYPGAKVDAQAYAPLAHELASRGWVCVVCQMPFDIAFFGQDRAAEVMADFPQVERWYIGGHSLGGVVAANFASSHSDELDGIVFLASYPTADLSGDSLQALSVYGANDGVLNRDAYAQAADRLPTGARELVIDGGNHAQFGSYGAQDGDGTAAISADEQVDQTVDAIDALGD